MIMYSRGLHEHNSNESSSDTLTLALLHLNRAAAHLHLERYRAALLDAEKCQSLLSERPSHEVAFLEKTLCRKGKAFYGLRSFRKSLEVFEEALTLFPDSVAAKEGLKQSESRIREEATGCYDMLSLYMSSQTAGRMDVGDHIGPVTVKGSPSKGRGLFTTRDVRPGEVLLATKAYAAVFPDEDFNVIALNLLTDQLETSTQVQIVSEVIYKLSDDPSSAGHVYGLHQGPGHTGSLDYDLHAPKPETSASERAPIDVESLQRVLSYNAFGIDTVGPATFDNVGLEHGDDLTHTNGTALFLQNSLVNHSCLYNATWACFGDFQIIRALVEIPKGTEVFISYVVDAPFHRRVETLSIKHVKHCRCELCQEDLLDGPDRLKRRKAILEADSPHIPEGSVASTVRSALNDRMKRLARMEKTYRKERSAFRPDMFSCYNGVAYAYGLLGAAERNIRYSERALECLGVCKENGRVPRHRCHAAVCSALQIAATYRGLGDYAKCQAWVSTAMHFETVVIGSTPDVFRERYSTLLGNWNLVSYVK